MQELAAESQKLAIMPTQGVIEYFIKNQESEGTQRTYGSALRGFFAWSNGKDYRTVTPFDALNYNEYLKETCAVATTQTKIATLKMFFSFAKDCGLIETNPFALVKQKASPSKVSEKFLTTKEIERLLNALKEAGEREYILGLLLASTGMRISEVQQISWKDFYEMPDGSISVSALRKGNERQLLSLRSDVWEAIKAYMGKEINNFDQSHLFSNPSGHRASDVSLRTWIEKAAKRAKINKVVTPHTLRHSFCSNALSAGADIRDVQTYLNHKSIMTTQFYMHGQNQKVGEFIELNIK